MNQTQINHFTNRMAAMVKTVTAKMRDELPLRDELTLTDKFEMIATGKARFREERFTDGNCDSYTRLLDSFEFPGTEEIRAFNNARAGQWAKIETKIKRESEKLVDRFVLERVQPDEALETLESMKFWEPAT